ncbi:hypothetical protein [Prevotella sp. OH937_COT-195]|uniref:hypothetical protein n=1 Tax=Prevotella sp. OH937_COT-195 TaxID=2491051 RepID=UPI000F646092|nr:hypothetical protein [Prevotella sp. OH937_COT-195]RRC98147.1 hypothetical protein EII32_09505 [Prevotella sp. OH937_COT-195]
MKKKQVEKPRYIKPQIECIRVVHDRHILAGSDSGPVTGGHHSAGDDEELNAKGGALWFDEEEGLSGSTHNLWDE